MQRRVSCFRVSPARDARLGAAVKFDLAAIERTRVLKAANQCLTQAPVTATASGSPRSAEAG
jgi:hypothetical protein